MATTTSVIDRSDPPILVGGMTWREFKATEQLLARPGVRLSFLDGVLEIRHMPGRQHETIKGRIGALIEAHLETIGLDFVPTESLTLESETGLVKREADKSYELGSNKERPDLAIEVIVTSGGIDKLTAYQRLQIPEVWFWEKGKLSIYALGDAGYIQIDRSQVLPSLDIPLLVSCIDIPNHLQAIKRFRQFDCPSIESDR
jgi:Uma2 family endonuclease